MTEHDATAAVHRAIAKRDRIINRDGDHNGERLEPDYLEQLIAEELRNEAAARIFNGCRVLERSKI